MEIGMNHPFIFFAHFTSPLIHLVFGRLRVHEKVENVYYKVWYLRYSMGRVGAYVTLRFCGSGTAGIHL